MNADELRKCEKEGEGSVNQFKIHQIGGALDGNDGCWLDDEEYDGDSFQ